jgi:hypothetical protein
LAILLGIPPERIVVTWLVGGWPLKRVRSLKGVKFETVLSFRGMEWTHTFFYLCFSFFDYYHSSSLSLYIKSWDDTTDSSEKNIRCFFPDWRQEDETTINLSKRCPAEMIYSNKFFGIQRNGGQQPELNDFTHLRIINLK